MLLKGEIGPRLDRGKDCGSVGLRFAGAPVSSDRLRSRIALRPFQRPPATDARRAHAKATSRASARRTLRNRRKHTRP